MAEVVNTAELTQALQEAAKAARALADAHSAQLQSMRRETSETIKAVSKSSEEYINTLTAGKDLSESEIKLKKKAIEQAKIHAKLEAEAIRLGKENNKIVEEFGATSEQAVKSMAAYRDAQSKEHGARSNVNQTIKTLSGSMGKFNKGLNLSTVALDWFASTMVTQGKQLIKQYQKSGGVIETNGSILGGLFGQQADALKEFVSGSYLAEVATKNRQVFNAMGGTTKALGELDPAITRFRILTGSAEQGLAMAAQAATDFAQKGVKPSAATIDAYTDDLVTLTKYTGLSGEAAREFYDGVAGDSDSLAILKSAREGERGAILANQRALINHSIAMGKGAKEAQEAAKMLNKMTAAKPLDRLKQAAKIRALGGAMGIAGSEEAAQAVTAGKRATADQRAALQQFSENAATTMDTMAGQGIGSEIFATSLLDKLDLDQYYGPNSAFSNTLNSALRPDGKAVASLKDASKSPEGPYINAMIGTTKALELVASGQMFLGTALAAATVAITLAMGGKSVGGLVRRVAGRFAGRGGGGAPGAEPTPAPKGAPAVPKGAPVEPTLTPKGAPIAASGAVAGAADEAVVTMSRTAAFKKLLGNLIGKVAAPVAGVMAGADEYQKSGNTTKAVATGAGTAGGTAAGATIGGSIGAVAGLGVADVITIPLGAIIGSMVGGWLGGKAGGAVGEAVSPTTPRKNIGGVMAQNDNPKDNLKAAIPTQRLAAPALPAGSELSPLSNQKKQDVNKLTAGGDDDVKAATITTADQVTIQVTQMDASNALLKQLADLTTTQVELSEKQLVALTMSEKEKSNSTNRSNLLKGNKFGSTYNYV